MNIQIYDVAVVAVVIGIVEVAKKAGVPTKWCPLLALIMGICSGIIFLSDGDIKKGIMVGLACGLSASGLYDNVMTHIKKWE